MFTVPPNAITPATRSSGGSSVSGDVASTVHRSIPSDASAPGARPKDSYRSFRIRSTGRIVPSLATSPHA
jgi:hypothetical protein